MTEDALDSNVAYWCEIAEAMAVDDVVRAMADNEPNEYRAVAGEAGGVRVGALAALNMGFLNRVVGLGVGQSATSDDLDAILQFYRRLEQTNVMIQPAPHARPPELRDWLVDRGFKQGRNWAKVWRSPAEAPDVQTGLRIEEIGPDKANAFGAIVAAAFEIPAVGAAGVAIVGRPGWHAYLGFDGIEPVNAAAMFIVEGEGVAWLGFGATLPEARGRGGQSAMFARRLRDAAQLGCWLAISETGEDLPEDPNPSYRNMVRAGFHLAYLRPNFNLVADES